MASRLANTQPSYDFLTGAPTEDSAQKKRHSFRHSTTVKPGGFHDGQAPCLDVDTNVGSDLGDEELRAQLKALQYEVESFKQEKEMTNLRHEKELRDAQTRADTDFQKAQVSTRDCILVSNSKMVIGLQI